jgi:hypothetical protein
MGRIPTTIKHMANGYFVYPVLIVTPLLCPMVYYAPVCGVMTLGS